MRFDPHFGIELRDRGLRQWRLQFAHLIQRVNRLSMQIAGMQGIGVDQPHEAHTGARQVLQHRAAQASSSHDEHSAFCQYGLTRRTYLLEQHLPGIIRVHRQIYSDVGDTACSWS
jgi:hypothetical protein